MPQFDQSTFFNQVTWFFLIFINFYFIITYFFLPNISTNIKFRKKKIDKNKNNINIYLLEKNFKKIQFSTFYKKLFKISNNIFIKISNNNLKNNENIKKNILKNNNINFELIKIFSQNFIYPKKYI